MVVKHRLIYEVEEIRGSCPVYKEGDRVVIDSQYPTEVLNFKESTALCMRILDNACLYLEFQAGSDKLLSYLGGGTGEVRFGCPMPGEPYTECGSVIFRKIVENLE